MDVVDKQPSPELMLKPRLFRRWDTYLAILVVGVGGPALTLAMAKPSERLWAIAFPFLMIAVLWYAQATTGIKINDERVVIYDSSMPRQTALRPRIASIHRRSYWVVFRDQNDQTILKTHPTWTNGQLHQIADALGVPLVDHVKGHGLKGRLFG